MTANTITNTLLADGELMDFKGFQASEVQAAIETLISRGEAAIETVTSPGFAANYQQIASVLDVAVQALNEAWGTVMHLNAVASSPALRDAVSAAQPLVSAFYARLSSNQGIYSLHQQVAADPSLTPAQRQAVSNDLRGARLAGAELAQEHKARFIETEQLLSTLSREYANHVLDATEAFAYFATLEELEGVPADVVARFGAQAEALGRPGSYLVGLQAPSVMPILQYATDRSLREKVYRANVTRASEFGPVERDNGPVMRSILALRQERAETLGLGTHATVSLVPKMAESPEEVITFLRDLARRARPKGMEELAELQAFAREQLGLQTLEAWDVAFAAEALRQQRYAFSEQEVTQHFRFDAVIAGIFSMAQRLFGVTFHPESTSTWHDHVNVYRVERDGEMMGRFYLDAFARTGKQGGAWMNPARPRWRRPDDTLRTATAYLVTNFAEPVDGQPTLLRHGEVVTLFHEFGHVLHFLLSEVEVLGVSGISGVEWDAVELPSQLMERFAWHWHVLEEMTRNPESGAGLPRALFDKMNAARNFQVGLSLMRQVELALFDMRLHAEPAYTAGVQAMLNEVRAEVALVPMPEYNRFPNLFSHIFSGAYAAGYYSYLWAEVLACDAWDVFEQAGNAEVATARAYRDAILSRGGSRPMRESFEAFRGRPPTLDALLRQRGLVAA